MYKTKISSIKITDLARSIAPKSKFNIIGIRPGEKIHEQMISAEDSYTTYEYSNHFKILPQINNWAVDKKRIENGKKVTEGFIYSSDTNSDWMTKNHFMKWLYANKDNIGKF